MISAVIAIPLVYKIAFIGATANIIESADIVVIAKTISENICVKAPKPTAIPAEHPTINKRIAITP